MSWNSLHLKFCSRCRGTRHVDPSSQSGVEIDFTTGSISQLAPEGAAALSAPDFFQCVLNQFVANLAGTVCGIPLLNLFQTIGNTILTLGAAALTQFALALVGVFGPQIVCATGTCLFSSGVTVNWTQNPPVSSTLQPGQSQAVQWQISGGGTVNHTNIHFGTDPNPQTNFSFTSTNEQSGGGGFWTGVVSIPSNVAPGTTFYFVVHAIVDNQEYFSSVVSSTIGGGGQVCSPNSPQSCTTSGGCPGQKVCNSSGTGFGPCAAVGTHNACSGTSCVSVSNTDTSCTNTCNPSVPNSCGGGGACAHSECVTGPPLQVGCSPCVTTVCTQIPFGGSTGDSFCCNNFWDGLCVNEAKQFCGGTCP